MKDFTNWHNIKTEIENNEKEKLYKEREVWWCSIGQNIGFEQDGKNEKFERPILVFRKFNKFMFLGIPLTSKNKDNKFYFGFDLKNTNKKSYAILSQIRLYSSKRLIRRMVRINEGLFDQIEEKFILIIKEKQNGPLSGSSGA
jgi:mRNA interferase MazF